MEATTDAVIEVDSLTKRYRNALVLDNVSLRALKGQITCLLSASGSANQAVLTAIAGLVDTDSGSVYIAGEAIDSLGPHRRPVGLLDQDPCLIQHLSVGENVVLGLIVAKVDQTLRRSTAEKCLAAVGLDGYADRWPHELSESQTQRAAIARCLVSQPRALLFDNAFSGLDRFERAQIFALLRTLVRDYDIAVVFTSDDIDQTFELADRIVVFDGCRIAQSGSAHELVSQPATFGVAELLGLTNVFSGIVEGDVLFTRYGTLRLPKQTPQRCYNPIGSSVVSPAPSQDKSAGPHSALVYWVTHPRSVRLISAADAQIFGNIERIHPVGSHVRVEIELSVRPGNRVDSVLAPTCSPNSTDLAQGRTSVVCEAKALWAVLDTSAVIDEEEPTSIWATKLLGARVGVTVAPAALSPITR